MKLNKSKKEIKLTTEELEKCKAAVLAIQDAYQIVSKNINFLTTSKVNIFVIRNLIKDYHDVFCKLRESIENQILNTYDTTNPANHKEEEKQINPNEVFN